MNYKHNKFFRYRLLCAAPLIFGLTVSSPSYAAQVLEEVIVTAQKREQNLQDVPISIQAFSEGTLQKSGVNKVEDLALVTPGLVMTKQLTNNTPYIRGVGNPDASIGSESPVSMYVDGVYMSTSNSSIYAFSSIDRVEVLKGPQGTLFGRNATGGLIHILTKDPEQETYVKGALSYGDYGTLGGKFYATTGLSDTVAADIALVYEDQDEGYGKNLVSGDDIYRSDEFGIRSKWLFTPTEDTEIRFIADYSETETSHGVIQAVYPGTESGEALLVFGGCLAALGSPPAAPDAGMLATCQGAAANHLATNPNTTAPDNFYDSLQTNKGVYEVDTWGVSLRIDQAIGEMDFTSITGYREASVRGDFEQLLSPQGFLEISIDDQSTETFTQEVQIQHQGDDFGWIIGAFYLNDDSGFISPIGLNVRVLAVADPVTGAPLAFANRNLYSSISTESFAVFGETNFSLTDSLRLTTGLRWTRDERELEQKDTTTIGGVVVAFVEDNPSDEWNELTWRLVLDYSINEDTLLYASYSRGFKSGNYNVSGIGTPPVDPEIIDAYELGYKATLLDGSAQLNMAVYYYDYTDLQVTRTLAGALITENAAAAEIYGFEADLVANLTDALSVRLGFSYIDSEYTDFPNAPVFTPIPFLGGNTITSGDVSGNALARTPDYTFNVGGDYIIPLNSGGEITFGANYAYNDGFSWEPSGRTVQDSYALLSAFVSWQSADGNWGVRLFGDNLTDEEYFSFVTSTTVSDTYSAAAPSTWGAEVSFEF
jgi:iron complex outermembrane recepter protein